jgi:nicotinamide-nucleotide amidase
MTGKRGRSRSTAVIVAVGSELLTPHKTDTNSLFITDRLNGAGVRVLQKLVAGDDPPGLAGALRYALSTADVVIVTGGLGPTADDVTRDVAAELLGVPLEESPAIVEAIRARFTARGLQMPESNRRQAAVPRGAQILENPRGTAPGLWLAAGDADLALLPGPPRELRPMFERLVKDRLAPVAGGRRVQRRMIRTTGRTESHVDELARPIYEPLAAREPPVETTILASLGQIDLHLSTVGSDPEAGGRVLDSAVAELAGVLGSAVVSTDGRSLPEVVGELLRRRGARMAIAESCTGGLLASRLTDVPGSSAYVHAGWVLYSNEAKVALGVAPELIESHGAVSEPVAEAMAVAARVAAGVEFGLAVTGIAGPDGATPSKPVGTVCLALVGGLRSPRVRRVQLPGDRERVKFQASQAALDLLRRALLRDAAAGRESAP